MTRGKKNCDSNDGNGLAALHVGAVENKLNRLPALKDSKLFHPVQLTPPVYLARREWIVEWSCQIAGFWYRLPKKEKKKKENGDRYIVCTCTLRASGTQVRVRYLMEMKVGKRRENPFMESIRSRVANNSSIPITRGCEAMCTAVGIFGVN